MSGGNKNKVQKHKNKVAFKIQFNPLALEIHKKVSLKGLCKRCADQISWKMQYNKYKKMSEPSKCNICLQKNVTRSYMSACEPCSQALKICPKCLDPYTEEQIEVRLNQMEQKKQDEENERKMNEFLKTLKQRSRRTVKRLFEKGTIQWSPELNNFVDQEKNPLTLQFRQGYGDKNTQNGENEDEEDIDEFGSEDQEEGQKEKSKPKQVAKAKQSVEKQKESDLDDQADSLNQQEQEGQEDQEDQEEEPQEQQIKDKKTSKKTKQQETKKTKIVQDQKIQTVQIVKVQANQEKQEQDEDDWSDCQQEVEQETNQQK